MCPDIKNPASTVEAQTPATTPLEKWKKEHEYQIYQTYRRFFDFVLETYEKLNEDSEEGKARRMMGFKLTLPEQLTNTAMLNFVKSYKKEIEDLGIQIYEYRYAGNWFASLGEGKSSETSKAYFSGKKRAEEEFFARVESKRKN